MSDGKKGLDSIPQKKTEVKELFRSDKLLEITLLVDDLKALRKDVGETPSWHKGLITYITEDSIPVSLQIKVKARGGYRKDPSNCSFPPLKVNFKKNNVDNTVFAGQNKIKLVTHCRNRSEEFNQYVLKEFLAYRIYNILTERSYRVRYSLITYVDGKRRYEPIKRYGFFIEGTRDMAERNGCTHVKVSSIPQEYTDFFYQDLLSVFQYMIGNTDWSVPGRHNIKLIQEKPDHRPVPVPYDFDWTGIVNPVYAKPSEKLGIKTVEERIFRGFEKDMEYYYRIFEIFLQKKEQIYALSRECHLNEKHQKRVYAYLDDFYEIIVNEKMLAREFIQKARTPNSDYWGK